MGSGQWGVGCTWQGELTDLDHESKCTITSPSSTQEVRDLGATVRTLQERLDAFELKFEEKEKEIAHLDQRMTGSEEKWNAKCKEVGLLEKEIENLQERNDVHERKLNSLKQDDPESKQEKKELENKFDKKFKSLEGEISLL